MYFLADDNEHYVSMRIIKIIILNETAAYRDKMARLRALLLVHAIIYCIVDDGCEAEVEAYHVS